MGFIVWGRREILVGVIEGAQAFFPLEAAEDVVLNF